jgi:hypothetical protein
MISVSLSPKKGRGQKAEGSYVRNFNGLPDATFF